MTPNNIYVQGSYIDIHDNENVYLSVDKGEVHLLNTISANNLAEIRRPKFLPNCIPKKPSSCSPYSRKPAC